MAVSFERDMCSSTAIFSSLPILLCVRCISENVHTASWHCLNIGVHPTSIVLGQATLAARQPAFRLDVKD
jgi:hypothetical protein